MNINSLFKHKYIKYSHEDNATIINNSLRKVLAGTLASVSEHHPYLVVN